MHLSPDILSALVKGRKISFVFRRMRLTVPPWLPSRNCATVLFPVAFSRGTNATLILVVDLCVMIRVTVIFLMNLQINIQSV